MGTVCLYSALAPVHLIIFSRTWKSRVGGCRRSQPRAGKRETSRGYFFLFCFVYNPRLRALVCHRVDRRWHIPPRHLHHGARVVASLERNSDIWPPHRQSEHSSVMNTCGGGVSERSRARRRRDCRQTTCFTCLSQTMSKNNQ